MTKALLKKLLTYFLDWFWIRPLRLTFRIQLGQYEYEVVVKIAELAQLFQFLQKETRENQQKYINKLHELINKHILTVKKVENVYNLVHRTLNHLV